MAIRRFGALQLTVRAAVLAAMAASQFPAAAEEGRAPPDPTMVARGEYLAHAGDCVSCHTGAEGKLFAGGHAMNTPFGTIFTTNITPDREHGIGGWTADQFYNALHTGRGPDGGLYYPAMPFASFTKVTRAIATAAKAAC